MTPERPSTDDAIKIASDLLSCPVSSAVLVRGGRNNRIFCVTSANGNFALKFYPLGEDDNRFRLGREYKALSFLRRHGIGEVPRPIARDDRRRCGAYEWIEGTPFDAVTETEVDALANFFIALQELRDFEGADQLVEASAGCLTLKVAADQLQQRVQRLAAAVPAGSLVHEFVTEQLAPQASRMIQDVRERAHRIKFDFDATLARSKQALSPSDFGFHNILRRPDGRLAFLDFEYFGWDDPAKAVADVMFHPGSALSAQLAEHYRNRVERAFSDGDPEFSLRLELMQPLVGLMWCVMLLNELLPDRWAHRTFAGTEEPQTVVLARQLEKSRRLFGRLLACPL